MIPLRAVSQFAIALWVLWTKALLVFKVRYFGVLSLRCRLWKLRSWCEMPTFPWLRKKLWICKFSSYCGLLCWGWVYGFMGLWQDRVPAFPPLFSLAAEKEMFSKFSGVFLRDFSMCRFGMSAGGRLRILLVTILDCLQLGGILCGGYQAWCFLIYPVPFGNRLSQA